jgi:hypothetical protein
MSSTRKFPNADGVSVTLIGSAAAEHYDIGLALEDQHRHRAQ